MKKIISVLVTYILMFAFIPHQAMILSRALESELIVYPQYDERIPRCYDYGVTVHQGDQSEKLTVYNRNTSGGTDDAVLLAPICQSSRNLLTEKEDASIWNPYSYPNVILSPHTDEGEVVLRCDVNQDSNNPGMFTGITDVLKQNGAGKYKIRFEAKSYDGNQYPVQIRIHNTRYEGYKLIQKTLMEAVAVNGEWSVYEAEFDLSDWDMSDDSVTHLRIGSDNTHGYDVLFRNIEMTVAAHEITGDVNTDGVFNITDVVLLQKWLLAVPDTELKDWRSGDLVRNGKLNAIDLSLMKRELFKCDLSL